MGDGIFCLDCGQDKYPESFKGHAKIIGHISEEWWPEITKARMRARK